MSEAIRNGQARINKAHRIVNAITGREFTFGIGHKETQTQSPVTSSTVNWNDLAELGITPDSPARLLKAYADGSAIFGAINTDRNEIVCFMKIDPDGTVKFIKDVDAV